MKKYIYILIGALVFTLGCDDDAIRIPDVEDGVQVRIQFQDGMSFFDFSDIANARIRYSIFSENTNLDSVIISITYQGDTTIGPVMTRVYRQSDFSNGSIANEELSITEIVELLDIDTDDLNGGDNFVISNRVVLDNGVSYPARNPLGNINIEPSITGSSATNAFTTTLNVLVGCPLEASFTGSYLLEQITENDNWNGTGNIIATGNVTLSVGSNPITRNFSVNYLSFPDRPFTIILLCGDVILPGFVSAGLSCDGGATYVGFGPDAGTIETYDPTDDSEILVSFIENPDLACGEPATPTTFRLTKQ